MIGSENVCNTMLKGNGYKGKLSRGFKFLM